MPPNNELMPNMSSSSSFVRRCIVVDDVGLDCSCVLLISLRFFFNVESKADAYVKKKQTNRVVFLLLTVIVDHEQYTRSSKKARLCSVSSCRCWFQRMFASQCCVFGRVQTIRDSKARRRIAMHWWPSSSCSEIMCDRCHTHCATFDYRMAWALSAMAFIGV
jgi:hypothetical protein